MQRHLALASWARQDVDHLCLDTLPPPYSILSVTSLVAAASAFIKKSCTKMPDGRSREVMPPGCFRRILQKHKFGRCR